MLTLLFPLVENLGCRFDINIKWYGARHLVPRYILLHSILSTFEYIKNLVQGYSF